MFCFYTVYSILYRSYRNVLFKNGGEKKEATMAHTDRKKGFRYDLLPVSWGGAMPPLFSLGGGGHVPPVPPSAYEPVCDNLITGSSEIWLEIAY